MHFDKCRQHQGSPLTWAYTFQCMETLNQIYLEQTGLQTGAETKRPSIFVKKMLSHKPCWDNRVDCWCLGRAQEWWLLPTNTRESNENQPGKHCCRMRRNCKCLQKHIEQILTSPGSSEHLWGSEVLGSSGLGQAEKEGTLCIKDFRSFRSFFASGAVFIGKAPARE